MGQRFRASGSRSGRTGGGPRIHEDLVQHEARHISVCVSDGFYQRSERDFRLSEGAVLYYADGEGCFSTGGGGDVHEGTLGWSDHGAVVRHGGSSTSSECSGLLGSPTRNSPRTVARAPGRRVVFSSVRG